MGRVEEEVKDHLQASSKGHLAWMSRWVVVPLTEMQAQKGEQDAGDGHDNSWLPWHIPHKGESGHFSGCPLYTRGNVSL